MNWYIIALVARVRQAELIARAERTRLIRESLRAPTARPLTVNRTKRHPYPPAPRNVGKERTLAACKFGGANSAEGRSHNASSVGMEALWPCQP